MTTPVLKTKFSNITLSQPKHLNSCHHIYKWIHNFHSDLWGPLGCLCTSSHIRFFVQYTKGTLTLAFCVEHSPSSHKCNSHFQFHMTDWFRSLLTLISSERPAVSKELPTPTLIFYPLTCYIPSTWKSV